jgi:hypothetical protein
LEHPTHAEGRVEALCEYKGWLGERGKT